MDNDQIEPRGEDQMKATKSEGPYARFAAQRGMSLKEYHAELKRLRKVGRTINPHTAETAVGWVDLLDPYDLHPDHLEPYSPTIGREQFARNPGGEWVTFDDLPKATQDALWNVTSAKND